jgi:hypothetical protein
MTIYWGLMVYSVDLAVPKIWPAFWSGGSLFMGLPAAAAFTHFKVQSKRVRKETKDAFFYSIYLMTGHLLWYAENERQKKCTKKLLSTATSNVCPILFRSCRSRPHAGELTTLKLLWELPVCMENPCCGKRRVLLEAKHLLHTLLSHAHPPCLKETDQVLAHSICCRILTSLDKPVEAMNLI